MLLRVKKIKLSFKKKKSLTSVNNNKNKKSLLGLDMKATLFLIPHPRQQLAICGSTCL